MDTVETAVYKLAVQGAEQVDAGAAAVDRLAVSEERLTRATRTSREAIDRLLGRLDPRIRAEQQLQRVLEQVNRFEEEGIGTATQRSQALTAATERYNQAIQRIKGTNAAGTFLGDGDAAKLSAFQLQNLSFQLQDVGQALATGQPLFRTFIQQGSQIAQIFGPGVGVGGALRAIGTGIVQYLTNPINVAIFAFAGATAGAAALFELIRNGGRSAEEILKRHDEAIREIKKAWDDASSSADQYGEQVQRAISFTSATQLRETQELLARQVQDTANRLNEVWQSTFTFGGPFQGAVDALNQSLAKGKPDIDAYNDAVRRIAENDPADIALQKEAARLIEVGREASKTAEKIRDLVRDTDKLTVTLGGLDYATYRGLAAGYDALVKIEQAQRQQRAALDAITARSPAEKAAAARSAVLAKPLDTAKDPTGALRQYEAEAAAVLALAQANHALSEAQLERRRSLEASVLSAQQDLALIGLGVSAQSALRMEYQLTAKIREEAAKNGVAVDEAEIELIRRKTREIGLYAEKLAETNKLRELEFERTQLFRSPAEQQVASTLREIYGDDYQSQLNGAIASQIRLNDAIQQSRDVAQEFASSFVSDLVDGKSAVEALGNALGRLGDRLIDLALNQAINSLFGGLFGGGGFGSGGIGLGLGKLFHSGGIVGRDGAARYVHPAYFDDAPRFARGGIAGLGPDEVPAILHRNEEVLRRDDPRHRWNGGGSGVSITVPISMASGATNDEIAQQGAMAIKQALDDYDRKLPDKVAAIGRNPRRRGKAASA